MLANVAKCSNVLSIYFFTFYTELIARYFQKFGMLIKNFTNILNFQMLESKIVLLPNFFSEKKNHMGLANFCQFSKPNIP